MKPNRRLGRLPRAHNPRIPSYHQMRAARLPPIPDHVNWLLGAPQDLGMMGNDRLGDCTIAALHHGRQVWSLGATQRIVTDPDSAVLADYEALCGYDPANPDTDQGGVLQAVLAGAVSRGITTQNGPDKLLGFYEIDVRNQQDVREVIALGGLAYIGIDLPAAWGDSDAGATWDATDSAPEGGHCVILVGYTPGGFWVVSWGMRFFLTNAGFAQACDEAYGLVSQDWITKTGKTPGGMTVSDLESVMREVRT
jgi:hypothetical protein